MKQDCCFIKKLVNLGLGFKSFYPARRTVIRYETIHIIRKEQIHLVKKSDVLKQVEFMDRILELLLKREIIAKFGLFLKSFRNRTVLTDLL